MNPEYIIIGSGLTGAVIARLLSDAGKAVRIIERRAHVGGNVHDHVHSSGIRIHTYGPHYFRTNDEEIWKFANRFATFYPYEACLLSLVEGALERWPISADYIRRTVGEDWKPAFVGTPSNFEEASLAMMPEAIYTKFVKGYSEKQWGVPASELSATLARRFDVREGDDARLMRHEHQGIPEKGYAFLMTEMLRGIEVETGCDFLENRARFENARNLVFTGPIDAFFGFDLGKLKYRGQVRHHEYLENVPSFQPCGQVNNPDPRNGPHIRTLEWKHMMPPDEARRLRGTVITRETTVTPEHESDYEYPFPDARNAELYKTYRERADKLTNVLICGRLGEYRYYDMDQAIGRAMLLARRLLEKKPATNQ